MFLFTCYFSLPAPAPIPSLKLNIFVTCLLFHPFCVKGRNQLLFVPLTEWCVSLATHDSNESLFPCLLYFLLLAVPLGLVKASVYFISAEVLKKLSASLTACYVTSSQIFLL